MVTELDKQITELDRAIADVLRDGAWARSAALMQTITGIGPHTTAWVLVLTVHCGRCPTPEAAAHDAGVIPVPRDSGTSVRGRAQIGSDGNARVRTARYRATINAARFNPVITAFDERLRAAGKPPNVARCAVARKRLLLISAGVRTQQAFDPTDRQTGGSCERQKTAANATNEHPARAVHTPVVQQSSPAAAAGDGTARCGQVVQGRRRHRYSSDG
jgi:transposase